MKKTLLLITSISIAFSAPAIQGEIKFKQENNSTFTANLKGDEYFSWVEDKQGNIIKYNSTSKNYEYAEIKINNGVADLVPAGTKVIEIKNSNGIAQSSSHIQPIKIDKKVLAEIWERKRDESIPSRVKFQLFK